MSKLKPLTLALAFACTLPMAFAAPQLIKPTDENGKPLNLDFEDGTLRDWDAVGSAFENQPLRGDKIKLRLKDSRSNHQGECWVGTFEQEGDKAQGTLTSVPFKVTHRYGSFLVGGGSHPETRVEFATANDKQVFFKTSASNTEGMRRVSVDLKAIQGKEIIIRVVDDYSGSWGHINFDDFVFSDTEWSETNKQEDSELAKKVPTAAIREHYERLGGAKCFFLLSPVGEESPTADGLGRFCRFTGDSSIYWMTNFGAWSIRGQVRKKWFALGAEKSVLGYPVTDELNAGDGIGRFNHFQTLTQESPGGSIYWTSKHGPWSIHGAIRTKWGKLGWETSILGYPVSDEAATLDGIGRFQNFKNPHLADQDGSIYVTPSEQAWEVHGPIREEWMSRGAERSSLGYPTSDQFPVDDGTGRVRNNFQKGTITYDPATAVATVP